MGCLLTVAHIWACTAFLLSECFDKVFAFEAQRRTYFQLCGNIFINEKTNIIPENSGVTSSGKTHQEKTLIHRQ